MSTARLSAQHEEACVRIIRDKVRSDGPAEAKEQAILFLFARGYDMKEAEEIAATMVVRHLLQGGAQ